MISAGLFSTIAYFLALFYVIFPESNASTRSKEKKKESESEKVTSNEISVITIQEKIEIEN